MFVMSEGSIGHDSNRPVFGEVGDDGLDVTQRHVGRKRGNRSKPGTDELSTVFTLDLFSAGLGTACTEHAAKVLVPPTNDRAE